MASGFNVFLELFHNGNEICAKEFSFSKMPTGFEFRNRVIDEYQKLSPILASADGKQLLSVLRLQVLNPKYNRYSDVSNIQEIPEEAILKVSIHETNITQAFTDSSEVSLYIA